MADKESIRSLLKQMSELMGKMAKNKEDLAKKALENDFCLECQLPPKTAKWLVDLTESPMTEKLYCYCDHGHEWLSDCVSIEEKENG